METGLFFGFLDQGYGHAHHDVANNAAHLPESSGAAALNHARRVSTEQQRLVPVIVASKQVGVAVVVRVPDVLASRGPCLGALDAMLQETLLGRPLYCEWILRLAGQNCGHR